MNTVNDSEIAYLDIHGEGDNDYSCFQICIMRSVKQIY